ncbi:MAG: response regulator transcription factor [Bacteroidetes bacterium]|nr:response regulator transcription factor [Bacteroidota bacterium]
MKNSSRTKVFLVEDDRNFGSVLKAYLEIHDFEVEWESEGGRAIQRFLNLACDICVLDVMLPGLDGFSIAREIRKAKPDMPFVFLTAKTLKSDILEGFNIGAEDYITKPFDSEVLVAKLKAIVNRVNRTFSLEAERPVESYSVGEFTYHTAHRLLSRPGFEQRLSPTEGKLLELLCENKNKLLTRSTALKVIWQNDNYFTTRTMDVYITKLRKYLKEDISIEIENLHSSGFILWVKE